MRPVATLGTALAVALAALALGAGAAGAATYAVTACEGADRTGPNRIFSAFGAAPAGCAYGMGLHARLDGPLAAGTGAGFVMTAPQGTSVYGYSIAYGVDWSSPGDGQWVSMIDAGDGAPLSAPCVTSTCSQFLPASRLARRWGETRVARSGLSVARLRLLAACGNVFCAGDALHPWWGDLRVTLADDSVPAVTGSGPDANAWLRGSHSIAYSASDNSGIRRTRLEVDGAVLADDVRSCDYTAALPCASLSAARYTVDTTKLPDGVHGFDVRAFDATDSNSATLHGRFRSDNTGPVTAAAGQGNPATWQPGPVTVTLSATDAASGMGAADDGDPVETGAYLAYSLDGGPLRKVAGDHADVEVHQDGEHRIVFRAYDSAGNASAERTVVARIGSPSERHDGTPPGFSDHAVNDSTFTAARTFAASCPERAVLAPGRAAWIDQSRPAAAGSAPLTIKGGTGAAARALLDFELPAAAGCRVSSAQLRVTLAGEQGGGALAAYRAGSSWNDDVTWATRPGVAGAATTVAAHDGELALDVTGQVRDQYAFGGDGLLLRYADERLAATATLDAGHPAQLVVTFE